MYTQNMQIVSYQDFIPILISFLIIHDFRGRVYIDTVLALHIGTL